MSILYALVARKNNVLAECKINCLCRRSVTINSTIPDTSLNGNFQIVTRIILSKIGPDDCKMSYIYNKLS